MKRRFMREGRIMLLNIMDLENLQNNKLKYEGNLINSQHQGRGRLI